MPTLHKQRNQIHSLKIIISRIKIILHTTDYWAHWQPPNFVMNSSTRHGVVRGWRTGTLRQRSRPIASCWILTETDTDPAYRRRARASAREAKIRTCVDLLADERSRWNSIVPRVFDECPLDRCRAGLIKQLKSSPRTLRGSESNSITERWKILTRTLLASGRLTSWWIHEATGVASPFQTRHRFLDYGTVYVEHWCVGF